MALLNKIEAFLDGKKSYLLMVSGVLTALIAFLNHTITLQELIAAIWASLSLGAVRSAIGNQSPKV